MEPPSDLGGEPAFEEEGACSAGSGGRGFEMSGFEVSGFEVVPPRDL